jgi:glycosyltransferase involved in cell wall biosynthesis
MRIAFLDAGHWDYHAATPYERPLGGSHSAMCYLAAALASRGHEVSLLNQTTQAGIYHGVRCVSMKRIPRDLVRGLDVAIVLNAASAVRDFRQQLPAEVRLVLWTQHADDQPGVRALADPGVVTALDGLALVSQWQQARYQKAFNVVNSSDAARPCCRVMRNAVAPAFEGLFDCASPIRNDRHGPAVLAYTSTPFRGLDLLLRCFPEIRRRCPGTTLRVYSSMQVYQVDAQSDRATYGPLYNACRATEGIQWLGSVPQPELAAGLRTADLLAYPNHFPETSCISVLEAMACGCKIVTSALAALPETTAGFAHLVPFDEADPSGYAARFIDAVCANVAMITGGGLAVESELRRQVEAINARAVWTVRARQWEDWLTELIATARPENISAA